MHIYDLTVPQLLKTLRNLDSWLTLGAQHAEKQQIPVDQMLTARLAPDQYNLLRQIQVATDNAKILPGRLTGKEWPPHPDTETTFEQLHGRIASVSSFIETFKREDFDDLPRRRITLPWMKPDQWLEPHDYVVQFGLPNFYFHVITAYAILRHKGVQLGKNDFIGGLPIHT
jgi:hypothetical protein